MANHCPVPLATLRIATAFVLLAALPSVARASCGDWLERSHSPKSSPSEVHSREKADDAIPEPAPSPCRGLACENSHEGPIPLTPTERRPQLPEELVLRPDPNRLTGCAGQFRLWEEKQRQQPGWPLQVDRPPEAEILHAILGFVA